MRLKSLLTRNLKNLSMNKPPQRGNIITRLTSLSEQGLDKELEKTNASERLAMMWQLALDAWAFKGDPVAEPRLPRHIVHLYRRKG